MISPVAQRQIAILEEKMLKVQIKQKKGHFKSHYTVERHKKEIKDFQERIEKLRNNIITPE